MGRGKVIFGGKGEGYRGGDICLEHKRSERICRFGEGTAGRRNSLHKGTGACYRNSKSPLWAAVAEWKVCVLFWLTRGRVGKCACSGGECPGLPRGQETAPPGRSFYLLSFSNIFPCVHAHPFSYRRLPHGQEGRERWSEGVFYGGGFFPLPLRPLLTPAKESSILPPKAVFVLNSPLSKTVLAGTPAHSSLQPPKPEICSGLCPLPYILSLLSPAPSTVLAFTQYTVNPQSTQALGTGETQTFRLLGLLL